MVIMDLDGEMEEPEAIEKGGGRSTHSTHRYTVHSKVDLYKETLGFFHDNFYGAYFKGKW